MKLVKEFLQNLSAKFRDLLKESPKDSESVPEHTRGAKTVHECTQNDPERHLGVPEVLASLLRDFDPRPLLKRLRFRLAESPLRFALQVVAERGSPKPREAPLCRHHVR